MSRIGTKPIDIPAGVKVELKGSIIKASGPLGQLQMDCFEGIKVNVNEPEKAITVENQHPQIRQNRQMHGTIRALVSNMVTGVSKGFEKRMEIYGTGYNIKEQNGKLILQVGYCHPVECKIPKGITVKIDVAATRGNDVPAKFILSGIDKALLGQFAAEIRKVRPPEPYKGKGIRYSDEHVRRKAVKAFASGAT